MRCIIFSIVLLLLFIPSCQSSVKEKVVDKLSVRVDIVFIDSEKVAIFITPTNEEITRLRLKCNTGKEFCALSDDAAYYAVKAEGYLKKENINIVNIDTTCLIINFSNSFCVNLSDTTNIHNPLFDIILYQKDHQPLISSSIDIKNDVYDYLGLENTVENINDVLPVGNGEVPKNSKWFGTYRVDVGYDEENPGDVFDVTLSIANDSVVYEAGGHTLDDRYRLSVISEGENFIKLAYYRPIANSYYLFNLKKTTDFGVLELHDGKYIWKNVKYLAAMTGKDVEYIMDKIETIEKHEEYK
ncbi:hypothetical protein [Bacteroides sp.]